jgi:myosin heavy subunit
MEAVQFSDPSALLRTVAAVLLLGDVTFSGDEAAAEQSKALAAATDLLGVDPDSLASGLVTQVGRV